jgi:hypothetical protein
MNADFSGSLLHRKACIRHAAWVGVALLVGAVAPVYATESFVGKCLLQVKAKRYLDGDCQISLETDGSFVVRNVGTKGITYFAAVARTSPTGAEGFWNVTKGSLAAQTPLGEFKRKGACWQNAEAKVCAWK